MKKNMDRVEFQQRKLAKRSNAAKLLAAESKARAEKRRKAAELNKQKYELDFIEARQNNLTEIELRKQRKEQQIVHTGRTRLAHTKPAPEARPSLMDVAVEGVKARLADENIDMNDSEGVSALLKS